MTRLLLVSLAALATLSAETYVIQNGTVMTVTKGTIKGSIVVKDGKIVEVGEKVMVPQGAITIDASGQYVIPGIIDCDIPAPLITSAAYFSYTDKRCSQS